MSAWRGRGFVLLPVVIALTLIATAALAVHHAGAVDAGLAGRSMDAEAARYVAEAGLAHLDWDLQKRDCLNYVDLNNLSLGPHRFTAKVSRTRGQPVTLSATSTTATSGSATLTRREVKVYDTDVLSLTIQAPDATGVETHVASNWPESNFGADNRVRVSPNMDRTLVRFDLSQIPFGARITAAQLQLYQTAGTQASPPATMTAYRVTRSWVEGTGKVGGPVVRTGASHATHDGTAAWTSVGGDHDPVPAAQVVPAPASGWRTWQVDSLVQGWWEGSYPNHGVLIVGTGDIGTSQFVASDDLTQPGNHPRLVISYRPLCGFLGPVTTATLVPVADADIDGTFPNHNYGGTNELDVSSGAEKRRALLKFDLSSVPFGAKLQSAKLRLHAHVIKDRTGQPIPLGVHALTSSWVEGTEGGSIGAGVGVTWNSRTGSTPWAATGADFRTQAGASVLVPASFATPGWMELDMRALAQEWVDGVTTNHGLLLQHGLADHIVLHSREKGSLSPQLVVAY